MIVSPNDNFLILYKFVTTFFPQNWSKDFLFSSDEGRVLKNKIYILFFLGWLLRACACKAPDTIPAKCFFAAWKLRMSFAQPSMFSEPHPMIKEEWRSGDLFLSTRLRLSDLSDAFDHGVKNKDRLNPTKLAAGCCMKYWRRVALDYHIIFYPSLRNVVEGHMNITMLGIFFHSALMCVLASRSCRNGLST